MRYQNLDLPPEEAAVVKGFLRESESAGFGQIYIPGIKIGRHIGVAHSSLHIVRSAIKQVVGVSEIVPTEEVDLDDALYKMHLHNRDVKSMPMVTVHAGDILRTVYAQVQGMKEAYGHEYQPEKRFFHEVGRVFPEQDVIKNNDFNARVSIAVGAPLGLRETPIPVLDLGVLSIER